MINKRRLALVLVASMLLIQSEVEYSSLKESKVELLTLYKGKTEDLRIVKKGKKTGKGYLYQGFNKKVISVSKTGKVTAKKAGTTTIVLKKKSNGKKTKIKIKVVDYVKELRISSATNLVMKQGMKKSIRATVYPKTAKNRQVSYKSSNRNIALVYSDGTVKAMESQWLWGME